MTAFDPAALPEPMLGFLRERHLASLTIVTAEGVPHVTPVGFTWDADSGIVRIITWNGSRKARLLERQGSLPAAVCSVDGGRWVTMSGPAVVTADPERCAEAVRRYAERYSEPKERGTDRRAIELTVTKVLGRA